MDDDHVVADILTRSVEPQGDVNAPEQESRNGAPGRAHLDEHVDHSGRGFLRMLSIVANRSMPMWLCISATR